MSDLGLRRESPASAAASAGLFRVESPAHALQRYANTAAGAAAPTRDDANGRLSVADESSTTSGTPVDAYFEHPQVIAQVLGYSWSDSYIDESPQQRRDRWLRHQSFGQVVASEGGTSPSTTVASTPAHHRQTSDTANRQRGAQLGEYPERYFSDDVWAHRPAAAGRTGWGENTSTSTPGSLSIATTGATSEMIVVSVAAPVNRRRGVTTTAATTAGAATVAGTPSRGDGPRLVQTAGPTELHRAASAQPSGVAKSLFQSAETNAAVREPVSVPQPQPQQQREPRQLSVEEELYRNEQNTKLSAQPAVLAARALNTLHRDESAYRKIKLSTNTAAIGADADTNDTQPVTSAPSNAANKATAVRASISTCHVGDLGGNDDARDTTASAPPSTKRPLRGGGHGRQLRAVFQDEDDT